MAVSPAAYKYNKTHVAHYVPLLPFHLPHLTQHLISQLKAIASTLYSKYTYTNNGNTTSVTNDGDLKSILGVHQHQKRHGVGNSFRPTFPQA